MKLRIGREREPKMTCRMRRAQGEGLESEGDENRGNTWSETVIPPI